METNTAYQNNPSAPKKKKGRLGLILFLLLLILAVAGGAAYYLTQRQQPRKTVEAFLQSIQKLDLPAMENMLQSQDVSALDEVELRTDTYAELFKKMNSQMTYEITKNNFHIQDGTAEITARIRYVDGTSIYVEAISEFLRQIVSSAFSGESLTEEQTEEKLVSILNEKAQTMEGEMTETNVTYPLVKTDTGWKIAALDEETIKFMSANFSGIEDEINASLNQMSDSAASDTTSGTSIDMTNDRFSIRYTQHRTANDLNGSPCLLLYYDYTNNGTTASSAMVDVSIQAYQDGVLLNAAIPETNDEAVDRYMEEIQPGQTVNVCQVFALNGSGDVTLQATDTFHLGGNNASQVLTLQ